jgi:putative DNA primase/helicase
MSDITTTGPSASNPAAVDFVSRWLQENSALVAPPPPPAVVPGNLAPVAPPPPPAVPIAECAHGRPIKGDCPECELDCEREFGDEPEAPRVRDIAAEYATLDDIAADLADAQAELKRLLDNGRGRLRETTYDALLAARRSAAEAWENKHREQLQLVETLGPRPAKPDALPAAVPENFFSCTDQANANRLQRMYHGKLISVAGNFYGWDGKRWRLDDGLAQRFACDLSRIVSHERVEAAAEFRKLNAAAGEGIGDQLLKLEEEIKALSAWAAKCESLATQNAALGLLRKLLDVPVERIDSNPWLLNVDNGTIDLKTGRLHVHNPENLITKLAAVAYDRDAMAPRFLQFLSEIFQRDAAVVEFVQRWYGYAATGDAREQKILIKHGPGGNGKSTLGEAIDGVLGEYSTPATLGLLTGKAGASDTAHLAEIADLRGRRLVAASESEDGAKLKEALLKQLTGGDTLKGKRLYGQLFAFKPTHKLELLTNHKPVIKGSDFSIWRRIMLLNFPVKYGSAADVAAGEAMAVRDTTLGAALKAEAAGILAWIVEGTRLWLAEGLKPPRTVLDANAEYRQQQDHVAEFLTECCTLAPGGRVALKELYASYKAWCHDAGREFPITRQRLVDELERRVPRFVRPHAGTGNAKFVAGLSIAPLSAFVPTAPEKLP